MAGEQGTEENKNVGDVVPKGDYDKVSGEYSKLQGDFEDLKMEILSPEYMAFLDAREQGDTDKPPEKKSSPEDIYAGMSPAQIAAAVKAELLGEIEQVKASTNQTLAEREANSTKRQVAEFAKSHDDYDKYRPVMYGLSLDPKFKDASINDLYVASKEHMRRLNADELAGERARQQKLSGERPGGASASYDDLKKLTASQASDKAFNDVYDKLGPPPEE